ncbi:MAG: hypothetical protein WBP45_11240 [Daejeonella sp.]
MKSFIKNEALTDDLFTNTYSGIDKDELIKKVHDILILSGYTPTEGQAGNAIYTKGSRTMRLLFGAFVKYFKFFISIYEEEDKNLKVTVTKQTSGMSGGLIGMNQVKNELKNLVMIFQSI